MNVLKNMEAIFLTAVVVIGLSAVANDAVAAATAAKNATRSEVSVSADGKMAIVTVTAKRLSPAAKSRVR
jgi:hypothetical protein